MQARMVELLPGRPALIRPGELLTTSPAAVARWALDMTAAHPLRPLSSFVEFGEFHGYATWSGTSFAGATIAGAVAHLCRDLPPAQAVRRLLSSGRRIPDLGVPVT